MFSEFLQRVRQSLQPDNPIWLTVYSDLMTNLMLFFLLLYGVSRMAPDVRAQIYEGLQNKLERPERTALQEKAKEIVKSFQEEESARSLEAIMRDNEMAAVDIDERRVKITLANPVLFASGRTDIKPVLAAELRELSPVLNALSNPIVVEGHTDNIPVTSIDYDSNWELSIARANAVIEFLVKTTGIPESRFIAAGYGEYHPAASNDTAEGRARNRRIEISLLRKQNGG